MNRAYWANGPNSTVVSKAMATARSTHETRRDVSKKKFGTTDRLNETS